MNILRLDATQLNDGFLCFYGPSCRSFIHTLRPKHSILENENVLIFGVKIYFGDKSSIIGFTDKEKLNNFFKLYEQHLLESKNLLIKATEKKILLSGDEGSSFEKDSLDFFDSAELQ